MGQGRSHCKAVLWAIYEDVNSMKLPADNHLEELWEEACGQKTQMDHRQIKKLFESYLEVAERIAPRARANKRKRTDRSWRGGGGTAIDRDGDRAFKSTRRTGLSDSMLGGEFCARFWELTKGREAFNQKNISKMLSRFRRDMDHHVAVFVRALDDDLSGEVDKFEFKEKIARLLFGSGAPLGLKLQFQGADVFQKEFRLNSLQMELFQWTNILTQIVLRIREMAVARLEDDLLIVKCTVRNPISDDWAEIQTEIEELLGPIHLESSTALSEVCPSIFLGDEDTAQDFVDLNVNGITHILAVGTQVEAYFGDKYKYLILSDIEDEPRQTLWTKFQEAFDFLDTAAKENGRAFVHSRNGESRSCALVIAYLMKSQDMTYDAALDRVRAKRENCLPNIGFEIQLREFQKNAFSFDHRCYRQALQDMDQKLASHVVYLSNRVPKYQKLLEFGAKVGNELLYITEHLYEAQSLKFDQDTRRIMAIAVERLRAIQRDLVRNHKSMREFNARFPKEQYDWVLDLEEFKVEETEVIEQRKNWLWGYAEKKPRRNVKLNRKKISNSNMSTDALLRDQNFRDFEELDDEKSKKNYITTYDEIPNFTSDSGLLDGSEPRKGNPRDNNSTYVDYTTAHQTTLPLRKKNNLLNSDQQVPIERRTPSRGSSNRSSREDDIKPDNAWGGTNNHTDRTSTGYSRAHTQEMVSDKDLNYQKDRRQIVGSPGNV